MESCAQCGHDVVAGRFCTHCGHPVAETIGSAAVGDETVVPPDDRRDDRTDTAERPALDVPVAPAPPAPAFETPPPARFPLYADDPAPPPNAVDLQTPAWMVETPAAPAPARRGRPVLPWIAGAVVILLLAGVGSYLLVGGDGLGLGSSDDAARDQPPVTTTGGPGGRPHRSRSTSPAPQPSSSAPPTVPPTTSGEPTDVVRTARVQVPASAEPGLDVDGNVVPYDASNMIDGVASTCWRMAGDGSGSVITIVLRHPTTLSSVGLINGYAKEDPGYDGYAANRRILSVVWTFDGADPVQQTFADERSLQSVEVPDVTAKRVELKIVAVSKPGQGRSGRDYTAISDLSLVGSEQ